MRIVMFYHSLESDWNHGNAHFLRGVATELNELGHEVVIYEPKDSWSRENLIREQGDQAIQDFHRAYPKLSSIRYDESLNLDQALNGADLALVHEWNSHDLVRRIGEVRARNSALRLLFHDTHHRSVTDSRSMAAYDLRHYDGVLAYGERIRHIYLARGWAQRAWTWHEAADTRVFGPDRRREKTGDLVWIGNWGDSERTSEIEQFLMNPVRETNLRSCVYGVRYPLSALDSLSQAGIEYGGWLPNFRVPEMFARHRVTIHIPRRPYVEALPGIPTIRPFEALACGIPMLSAPWNDTDQLFRAGQDYLVARNGVEMKKHLQAVLSDPDMAQSIADSGRSRILARHTCAHRVGEILKIFDEIAPVSRRAEVVESV